MDKSSSLAGLLKLALALKAEDPVFATGSFDHWMPPGESSVWPAPANSDRGLWLIDTRDPDFRGSRGSAEGWQRVLKGNFDAALILTGSGRPGSALRRALRRLRRPGMQRLAEHRVMPLLANLEAIHRRRLAFDDGPEVPTDFNIQGHTDSTGAAILLMRQAPFTGPLWSVISDQFGDPALEPTSLQLRVRGAAVLGVRSRGRDYVVRVVPEESNQGIVLRNHARLIELHRSVQSPTLRGLMPEPLFVEKFGSIVLLAESCLPGTPAWQIDGDLRRGVVYPEALSYLSSLGEETRISGVEARESLERHIQDDLVRLDQVDFVDSGVRGQIQEELAAAAATLEEANIDAATSHGDFGYGNLLADPRSGRLLGVIDWDTARPGDFPGVDRVNLELQIRRTDRSEGFATAVGSVWEAPRIQECLGGSGGAARIRALFGLAVCRYVLRSLSYPAIYREEADGFRAAMRWLASNQPAAVEAGVS